MNTPKGKKTTKRYWGWNVGKEINRTEMLNGINFLLVITADEYTIIILKLDNELTKLLGFNLSYCSRGLI